MSFVLCEICLVPSESWRLKSRDLSAFYALHPAAFEGIQQDTPAWLCAFCWTRVCQCVHFIDTAITSRIFLSAKNRLAAIPSTDVHAYVVKSLPSWEVGLEPAHDPEIKIERKEEERTSKERKMKTKRKGTKNKPNDLATNILKEVLKDLESAKIDLNSSSNCFAPDLNSSSNCFDPGLNSSSNCFDPNIALPVNPVIQECRDHSSEPCLINDGLDVAHPEETIIKPVEKVQGRSKFPIKDTGETEFLKFLESKKKPRKTNLYSMSSIFKNFSIPPIQVQDSCDGNIQNVKQPVRIDTDENVHMSIEVAKEEPFETFSTSENINDILGHKEVEASSEDVGAKLCEGSEKKRKKVENEPGFEDQVAAFGINEGPVEDVQMLLDEVKEEPIDISVSENLKASSIFEEAEAVSKEIGVNLSNESNSRRKEEENVPELELEEQKLEALKNIDLFGVNERLLENRHIMLEVKEESFEVFTMSENSEASTIFGEAVTSSKATVTQSRTDNKRIILADSVPEFIENGAPSENIPVFGINQRPIENLSFKGIQVPYTHHICDTVNETLKRKREQK